VIEWSERGAPPCEMPVKAGFGSVLIEQGLRTELEAVVSRQFRPDGLLCTISVPLNRIR